MSIDFTGVSAITTPEGSVIKITRKNDGVTLWEKVLLPAVDTLNNTTWEDIKTISDAGQAANYWAIGDRKAVTLNGTVGSVAFSNNTYYCYIIGFDHNSSVEGTNRIHFQFGYTALTGGVHIAFIDSRYGYKETSGSRFNINNSDTSAGGWNGSSMRNNICTAFKNALPSDLRTILNTVTKYSDNTGGGQNTASYVTSTSEEIFLLAEYELFGVRTNANSAEQNYQQQYAYYSIGNSKKRYRHSSTSSAAIWWLRSTRANANGYFCCSNTGGTTHNDAASRSYGFSPAFCV